MCRAASMLFTVLVILALRPALALDHSSPSGSFEPLSSDVLTLSKTDLSGDASDLCVKLPGLSACRKLSDRAKDTLSVADFRTSASVDGVNDDVAIQATLNLAAVSGGGRVYLPPRTTCYRLSAPITVTQAGASYLPIVLYGGGAGTCLQPSATMDSMVTANGRFLRIEGISFQNARNLATNGVKLTCAVGQGNTNNYAIVEKNYFYAFANAFKNVNCDAWRVSRNWFQNNTAWDIISLDNGTASKVAENYSIGSSGNVLMDRVAGGQAAEGYYIDGNVFLPTGGKSVVLRGCLSCFVRGNQLDQTNDTALTIDGTSFPIADVGISDNWFGPKEAATAADDGVVIKGNVNEVRMRTNTANGWKKCGVRLAGGKTAAVQNVDIDGLRAINNGNGATTGDVCVDQSAGGVGAYTVRNSWLLSTGQSQRSAVETGAVSGTWFNNRLASPPTKSPLSLWHDNLGDDRDIASGKYTAAKTLAFTPSCTVGTPGAGATGTVSYTRDRNIVTFSVTATMPNIGSCSNALVIALPFMTATGTPFAFSGWNDSVGALIGIGTGNQTAARVFTITTGFPLGNGQTVAASGTYEAVP